MRTDWLKVVVICVLTVVVGYLFVHKQVLDDAVKQNPYSGGRLLYNNAFASVIDDFAVTIDGPAGQFYFRESEGNKKGVRLWFAEYAEVIVELIPRYSDGSCRSEALDEAHLFLSTSHQKIIHRLVAGTTASSEFQIHKDDELSVEIINSVQTGCGSSEINLYVNNKIDDYPELFILIWLFVLALFMLFGLPLFIQVFGVLFNAALVAVLMTTQAQSLATLLHATLLTFCVCGLWLIVRAVVPYRLPQTLLVFVLLLLAATPLIVFGVHYFAFDAAPTVDTIHAMLQSHKNQIMEFLTNILGWKYIVGFLLALFAILTAIYISSSPRHSARFITEKGNINRKVTFAVGLLFVLIGARDVATHLQMNSILHTVNKGVASYFYEVEEFQKLSESRISSPETISATTAMNDTTLLVVIGESASKTHFSTYGYPLKTTPVTDELVQQGSMLKFSAAYANHTYSNPTISRALTQASNYNDLPWTSALSVLSLANAAKINTTWISNKLKFGPWDNVMSVIGDDAQNTIHINSKVGENLISNRYDGALVPLVEQALQQSHDNKAIFVHLQGSHVGYDARYPSDIEQFDSRHASYLFGKAPTITGYNQTLVNHYDNSIYYTDTVLEQIITLLENDANKPTALLYFSDHGESVFSGNSHNAAVFDYEMAEIPMLFWANSAWQEQYQNQWRIMQGNQFNVFSNDHIFDTVAGLLGIQSDYNRATNDLSSERYQAPIKPTTLHGELALDKDDNNHYWMMKNIQFLQTQKPSIELSASVETVGELKQLLAMRVGRVYLDVDYDLQGNEVTTQELVVATDKALTDYLAQIDPAFMGRLMLRMAQTDSYNYIWLADRINLLIGSTSDNDLEQYPTVLLPVNNLELASLLDEKINVEVYLPYEVDLSAMIELLPNALTNQRIKGVVVPASAYQRTQELLSELNVAGRIKLTVEGSHIGQAEGSQQLQMDSLTLTADLLETDYFNSQNVSEVLLNYKSQFSLQ